MSLQITRVQTPIAKFAIKCTNTMKPTHIVVHDTANDASAMAEISYMLSNNNWTSFHFAVDDYRAVQGLPLDRNGWHSGDGQGKGNRSGIAIETCYSLSGGPRYTQARQNCAELVAILLKQYGWGVDKVTKHQDYSGKYCPHRNLNLGWKQFIQMCQAELDKLYSTTPQPTTIVEGTLVKITGDNYATGQSIPQWVKNAVYTVSHISGDKALLGAPDGINSWVLIKDLQAQ